ncbi:aldehyde dehydrogenase family protein, partial [Porticoccaceae bacterium]|nr:aldehyde dehydrogenase family protein [Porticoccaceae bacterium]
MTVNLQDPSLITHQSYINGQWVDADSGETLDVTNPATGQLIGVVAKCGTAETRRMIDAAAEAQKSWCETAKQRAALLRKWYDLIMANQEDLAQILTAEQGKPLAEARGEIVYGA